MNRWRRLPWWLGGIYLCWSVLVYFGSLKGEHQWWPIMLYPIIWPWGWLYKIAADPLLDAWLTPEPKLAPGWVWLFMDRVCGAFYIIWGTLWMWIVGKTISITATRLCTTDNGKPNHAAQSTAPKGAEPGG